MHQRDFTSEAESLFATFALRHGLAYEIDDKAPVEVCWRFPAQPGLSEPIILGLQNGDELNFGVGKFWSYFFPFLERVDEFARVLDAWVGGEARVISRVFSEDLQLRDGDRWRKVYSAGRIWPELGARRIVRNCPTEQDVTLPNGDTRD